MEGKAWKARSEKKGGVKTKVSDNGKGDRKSTRLNSSHEWISYAVFCLKKKKKKRQKKKTGRKSKEKQLLERPIKYATITESRRTTIPRTKKNIIERTDQHKLITRYSVE